MLGILKIAFDFNIESTEKAGRIVNNVDTASGGGGGGGGGRRKALILGSKENDTINNSDIYLSDIYLKWYGNNSYNSRKCNKKNF